MTISRKIQLSILLLTLIGLVGMGTIYYELTRLHTAHNAFISVSVPRKSAVYEMEINTIGRALAVTSYLDDADPQHLWRFAKDTDDFDRYFAQYSALATNPREKMLAEKLTQVDQQFRAQCARLIKLGKTYEQGTALVTNKQYFNNKSITEGVALLTQYRNALDQILDEEIQAETLNEYQATLATTQAILNYTVKAMVVLGLLFVTTGTLCAVMLMRLVARPAQALVTGADILSAGICGTGFNIKCAMS
jgi:CHASE3 domain sensor protein